MVLVYLSMLSKNINHSFILPLLCHTKSAIHQHKLLWESISEDNFLKNE